MTSITKELLSIAFNNLYLPGQNNNCGEQRRLIDLRLNGNALALIVIINEKEDPEIIEQAIRQFFTEHFPTLTLSLLLTNKSRRAGLLSTIPIVIAVASGKGGVGKSTTSVCLSIALQQQGIKVGLLDADIYGPSLPTIMGLKDKPSLTEDKKIMPLFSQGIHWISIGSMIPAEKSLVWRGPMVQSALLQLIKDVDWTGMDILIIDLPPGTGDIHLTLAQQVSLTGVLIVSTPQELALADARKGIHMFQRMGIPILGMVETMAEFICPHCHVGTPIFDQAGGAKEAEKQQIPFLGSVPLDPQLRLGCDEGRLLEIFQTDNPGISAYKNIAHRLLSSL